MEAAELPALGLGLGLGALGGLTWGELPADDVLGDDVLGEDVLGGGGGGLLGVDPLPEVR